MGRRRGGRAPIFFEKLRKREIWNIALTSVLKVDAFFFFYLGTSSLLSQEDNLSTETCLLLVLNDYRGLFLFCFSICEATLWLQTLFSWILENNIKRLPYTDISSPPQWRMLLFFVWTNFGHFGKYKGKRSASPLTKSHTLQVAFSESKETLELCPINTLRAHISLCGRNLNAIHRLIDRLWKGKSKRAKKVHVQAGLVQKIYTEFKELVCLSVWVKEMGKWV